MKVQLLSQILISLTTTEKDREWFSRDFFLQEKKKTINNTFCFS